MAAASRTDYDIYAEGEAELGWLNSSVTVVADQPFDLDRLLVDLVERLRLDLAARDAETAHLKTIGLWEGYYGVANLISRDAPPELSLPSRCQLSEANVVINARVAIDPVELQDLVAAAVVDVVADRQARVTTHQTQSFRPSRPTPTHRYAAAVN